jgi:hypothetical protein
VQCDKNDSKKKDE